MRIESADGDDANLLHGATYGGRLITIAIAYDGTAKSVRPITAWGQR